MKTCFQFAVLIFSTSVANGIKISFNTDTGGVAIPINCKTGIKCWSMMCSGYDPNLSNTVIDLQQLCNSSNPDMSLEAEVDYISTQMTRSAESLTHWDLFYTQELLNKINKPIGFQTAKYIVNIMDRILQTAQSAVSHIRQTGRQPGFTEILDKIMPQIVLEDDRTLAIVGHNMAILVWAGQGMHGLIPVYKDTTTMTDGTFDILTNANSLIYEELDVAIILPLGIFSEKDVKVFTQVYFNDTLFDTSGKSRYNVNSKVLSVKVMVNGAYITYFGDLEATLLFRPFQNDAAPVCGYWDYTASNWAVDGCRFEGFKGKRAVCKCNHLTNFALLLDLHGKGEHDPILDIITMVGASLSIFGLTLTVSFFILFRTMRTSRGQKVLFNLSLSMLCSMVVFVVGIDRAEHRAGCIVVAVLLHYFILVTFMWMLVEAILQYLALVKILGTYIPNFIGKAAFASWGIPLIPVGVVCAIDYNLYFGGLGYCWMSLQPLLYAFAIPVGIIICVNLTVFVMIVVSLCRRGRLTKDMKTNQPKDKTHIRNFQAILVIFFLLGLTWIAGYLALEEAKPVMNVIFCLVGSLHGFFIFIVFTIREEPVRVFFGHTLCCRVSAKAAAQRRRHGSTDTFVDFFTSDTTTI